LGEEKKEEKTGKVRGGKAVEKKEENSKAR
jgi:hypothetical protein